MEDKTLELLTKMYGEFTEFRKETRADIQGLREETGAGIQGLREETRAGIQGLTEETRAGIQGLREETRADIQGLRDETRAGLQGLREETKADLQGLKDDIIRIENDHGQKLDALCDGYKQLYEKLDVVEGKVDGLSEKVDRHDIRIQVIEGGRK